jgi:geranylgeranyl diphosphate synthase, type I
LHLTQGQHLDLTYETRCDLTIEDYWTMVEGKTAALISACTGLGAITAYCSDKYIAAYREFGRLLGLAFQAEDDLLGIWGDSALTGKSNQGDLVTGKLTLPVLFGLSKAGKFAERWNAGPITESEISSVTGMLEAEGAREYTRSEADRLLKEALSKLEDVYPADVAGEALVYLAKSLINRQV